MRKLLICYLFAVGFLLVGWLLSYYNGLDIYALLNNNVGCTILAFVVFLTFLFIAFEVYRSEKEKDKRKLQNVSAKKDYFSYGGIDVDKKLLQDLLSSTIETDDEVKKVEYILDNHLITVVVKVKDLEQINSKEIAEEYKSKLKEALYEKFLIENEVRIKFKFKKH